MQRGVRFLEARVLLSQPARKASLMSVAFASFFDEERRDGSLAAARCLLPGFLSCAGNLLRLVLGNGIWVGGIEIEALDDLRFEKSTS